MLTLSNALPTLKPQATDRIRTFARTPSIVVKCCRLLAHGNAWRPFFGSIGVTLHRQDSEIDSENGI